MIELGRAPAHAKIGQFFKLETATTSDGVFVSAISLHSYESQIPVRYTLMSRTRQSYVSHGLRNRWDFLVNSTVLCVAAHCLPPGGVGRTYD